MGIILANQLTIFHQKRLTKKSFSPLFSVTIDHKKSLKRIMKKIILDPTHGSFT